VNLSDADSKETTEERVLRRSGLETRHRAEIVVSIVPDAGECHVNQAAVVGFERDPQVERQGSVGAGFDPIAAGEHFAAKPLAFERTADDMEARSAQWSR
jgi:hypothetical protein